MQRQPVTSGLIKSVGFENDTLEVEFARGGVYQYTGKRAQEHHANMMAAPSVGGYFLRSVKTCPDTTCQKVS